MRFQVNKRLGLEQNVNLLYTIIDAPNEVFETPIIHFIEYLWLSNRKLIILLNSVYIVYPLSLCAILAFTQDSLHDNWQLGLATVLIPASLELFQMLNDIRAYY